MVTNLICAALNRSGGVKATHSMNARGIQRPRCGSDMIEFDQNSMLRTSFHALPGRHLLFARRMSIKANATPLSAVRTAWSAFHRAIRVWATSLVGSRLGSRRRLFVGKIAMRVNGTTDA